MGLLNRCFGVSELNFRDAMGCLGGSEQAGAVLTSKCNGCIIRFKTKEGRGSAHYELIWKISVRKGDHIECKRDK